MKMKIREGKNMSQTVPPEMDFQDDEFEEYAERIARRPARFEYAWEKVAANAVPPNRRATCCGISFGATTAADLERLLRYHKMGALHNV
jgi:hypothetical protein